MTPHHAADMWTWFRDPAALLEAQAANVDGWEPPNPALAAGLREDAAFLRAHAPPGGVDRAPAGR